MKNVLIIGGGRGQIPIIELCRNYGYRICVVSPKGNYPGINIADEVLYEDVKNLPVILKYAKEKNISSVLTDQLDEGVVTAAYIADQLGLNGIGYDTSLKFTNKFIMRDQARKSGINVPKCFKANRLDEAEEKIKELLQFPIIMKPVDSAASRGVYKINSFGELKEKFDYSAKYSKNAEVIIEEFIEGKEYVVEAFTKDYIVKNLVIGHRDYFDIPNTFIPNATVFRDANSATTEIETRIKEINLNLVESFGLKFGITHAEYLYNEKNDKIYLVEIAARGGGVFISSDLIPTACGVNANDLLVKEALGIEYDDGIKLKKGASAYFCYITPKGKVKNIIGAKKIPDIQGVRKAFFDNIEVGMQTGDVADKSSRKGPILVFGNEKEDCYNVIEKVKSILDITVETEQGIEKVLWK